MKWSRRRRWKIYLKLFKYDKLLSLLVGMLLITRNVSETYAGNVSEIQIKCKLDEEEE